MATNLFKHCWHWSTLSYKMPEAMEECCNCDKVIEEYEKMGYVLKNRDTERVQLEYPI